MMNPILHKALVAYLLTAMGVFYPQQNHNWKHHAADWYSEDADVTEERYELFASEVAAAVEQPYVQPVFADKDPVVARAKTALLLVAIAADESTYKADVIDCAVAGDKGASWGAFQTSRAKARTCSSVMGAAGVAIEMIQESFRVCRGTDPLLWLAEYTDGGAYRTPRAAKRSARRMGRAIDYWKAHPFAAPSKDL